MANTHRHELYALFQETFPLETLKDMPLEKYTNLNKSDSFCYWIESRTYDLGSFWGGSSYKFGIYKYNNAPKADDARIQFDDEYAWYQKYNKETAQEAYLVVRDAVIRTAEAARRGDFEAIDMIEELGDSFKWKIAFLYSNETLIPVYKREMLETMAERLGLDNPKSQSVSAIQRFFIQEKGDDDIYEFHDQLFDLIRETRGQKHIWIFGPGENGRMWNRCVKNNEICIGWDEVGDLSQFRSLSEYQQALRDTYDNQESSFKNDRLCLFEFTHVMKPGDVVYARQGTKTIVGRGIVESEYYYDETQDTFRNVHKVNWTNLGEWDAPWQFAQKTLTDIGKFPDYASQVENIFRENYDDEEQYWWLVANPKIWSPRSLNIDETVDYSLYNENGHKRKIFQNFLDAKVNDVVFCYESTPVKKVTAAFKVARPSDGETITFRKWHVIENPIPFEEIANCPQLAKMQFLENTQGSFYKLTEEEADILFAKAMYSSTDTEEKPVKTYTKEDFLSEVYMEEKDYDKLHDLILNKKNIILQGAPGVGKTFSAKRLAYSLMGMKEDYFVELVQFHQNYSYEDFILGYKPNKNGGFKLFPGVFLRFCAKANEDPAHKYFFIIDEINRGNLSKIFGELMMLIENDYRGTTIKLAYEDNTFCVPKNVYIIGMMNTADRSLAMIDYALRRRFSFFDMRPGFATSGFVKYQQSLNTTKFDAVINGIIALNEVISADDSLGDGFCIGHSYFCNQTTYSDSWLSNVIEFDVIPMLREYWFDNDEKYKAEKQKLEALIK